MISKIIDRNRIHGTTAATATVVAAATATVVAVAAATVVAVAAATATVVVVAVIGGGGVDGVEGESIWIIIAV